MEGAKDALGKARERGAALGLPYSGAILPQEAWAVLQAMPDACLLDVRTAAELQFAGSVPGALAIEWKTWPGMLPNARFLAQAEQLLDKGKVTLLLCRTGVRSDEAARLMAGHGFAHVYNILEGFEGEHDASGQRGKVTGWKARGLPWQQP